MKRRGILVSTGFILITGCVDHSLTNENVGESTDDVETTTEISESDNKALIETCEREQIQQKVDASEDETLDDISTPIIVETESRSRGTFVEVETGYATLRTYGEDEPKEHTDYLITSYYLITNDGIYRTEDANENPREGTEVDC